MNLKNVDLVFETYQRSTKHKLIHNYEYFQWVCSEYIKIEELMTEIKNEIDTTSFAYFELNELQKLIKRDAEYWYFENFKLDNNLKFDPVLNMIIYHSNSYEVELMLSDLYKINFYDKDRTLKHIYEVIKQNEFWCHIINSDLNIEIVKISRVFLFDKYRSIFETKIIESNLIKDTTSINLERLKKVLIEYFSLPFHTEKFSDTEINYFANSLVFGLQSESKIIKYLSKPNNKAIFQNYIRCLNQKDNIQRVVTSSNKSTFIRNLSSLLSPTVKKGFSIKSIEGYFWGDQVNQSFKQISSDTKRTLKSILPNINFIENKDFIEKIIQS